MSNKAASREQSRNSLVAAICEVRQCYDQLDRGKIARLRRCHSAKEVELEGTYWRIGGELAHQRKRLSHVVLQFPLAAHTNSARFQFGTYLRHNLDDNDGATLRFRRLLASRDNEELDHRLRGILKLAGRDRAPINWGLLGKDILNFLHEDDFVRRQWSQNFYAPSAQWDQPQGSQRIDSNTNPTTKALP